MQMTDEQREAGRRYAYKLGEVAEQLADELVKCAKHIASGDDNDAATSIHIAAALAGLLSEKLQQVATGKKRGD